MEIKSASIPHVSTSAAPIIILERSFPYISGLRAIPSIAFVTRRASPIDEQPDEKIAIAAPMYFATCASIVTPPF